MKIREVTQGPQVFSQSHVQGTEPPAREEFGSHRSRNSSGDEVMVSCTIH